MDRVDMQLASDWLASTLFRCDLPLRNFTVEMVEGVMIAVSNSAGNPTRDFIIHCIGVQQLNHMSTCALCSATGSPVEQDVHRCVKFALLNYQSIPNCLEFATMREAYRRTTMLPDTYDQLVRFVSLVFNTGDEDEQPAEREHAAAAAAAAGTSRLSVRVVQASQKSLELYCAMCQLPVETGTEVIELACGHEFHNQAATCLKTSSIHRWLGTHATCPVCKAHAYP